MCVSQASCLKFQRSLFVFELCVLFAGLNGLMEWCAGDDIEYGPRTYDEITRRACCWDAHARSRTLEMRVRDGDGTDDDGDGDGAVGPSLQ